MGTAGNVATACRLVEMAADRAASLLLLPEAFLAGYDPELFAAGWGGLRSTLRDRNWPHSVRRAHGAELRLSSVSASPDGMG